MHTILTNLGQFRIQFTLYLKSSEITRLIDYCNTVSIAVLDSVLNAAARMVSGRLDNTLFLAEQLIA